MRIVHIILLVLLVFVGQVAIHKMYIHRVKFDPAADRCNAMNGDLSPSTLGPRGRCIDEMFAAMDEGNDMFWFLHLH